MATNVFGSLRGIGAAMLRRISLSPSASSSNGPTSPISPNNTFSFSENEAFGLADLINLSSALKQQNETETRAKRLPLESKLTELLDRLHETELELRLIDLLLATGESAPGEEIERNERFEAGIKDITEEFLRGFEDLLKQRDGIVENGKLVPLDKNKRQTLLVSQRNNIDHVLRQATLKLKQMSILSGGSEAPDSIHKRRNDLMQLSEELFEEKNNLTMELEGDLSEELREKQAVVESQKRKLISSNLLLICERGDYEQALQLLQSLDANKKSEETKARKATVLEQKDRDGNTPLLVACGAGSLPLVKLLYDAGSTIDIANAQQQTVLHRAAQNGNAELISWLLKQPEWMLAPPPTTNAIDAICSFGRTPLHYAAFNGHLEAVELLLLRGANVNATLAPPQLLTPLHNAVMRRHLPVVKRLLEHFGIDPFIRDGQKWTPLHCATADQEEQIVRVFLTNSSPSKEIINECIKLAKDYAIVTLLKQYLSSIK